jgi:hypothetical protein
MCATEQTRATRWMDHVVANPAAVCTDRRVTTAIV